MIKSTFQTLKKNPKAFLLFAFMLILTLVIALGTMILITPKLTTPFAENQYDNIMFLINYTISMGIIVLGYLLIGFLVAPAVGNYVYEMCAGKLKKGWYKRGLKRGWWKVVVLALIMTGVVIGVVIVMMILMILLRRAFILGIILYFLIAIAFSIYMILAFTAIMAEDKFSVGLANTFKIGNKYFFRLFGTMLLVYIPSYVASFTLSYSSVNRMVSMMNYTPEFWITYGLISIYGIFASTFLFTYSMNQYLNKKSLLEQEVVMSEKPETMQMESNETMTSENNDKVDE